MSVADTTITGTAGEVGRRERKKLETRRALAHAALQLAAEKGPDQVTIEEIADAADVSVRTFFNYFSSKEEAITNSWDPESLAGFTAQLRDRPADEPPLVALREVLVGAIEGFENHADARALRHRLVRENPSLLPRFLATYVELERQLVEALAARLGVDPEEDIYPALVVATGVGAMRLALSHWEATERPVPVQQLIHQVFASLEGGLQP